VWGAAGGIASREQPLAPALRIPSSAAGRARAQVEKDGIALPFFLAERRSGKKTASAR
jgi:hypothetical protein